MLQLGDEHRRHPIQRGAALGLDRGQGGLGLERLGRVDHGRSVGGAGQVAQDHAEAVVQRHRDTDPVGLGVAAALADEVAVVEDVVVRQGGALGEPGGAGGVLDVDGVVELEQGLALAQPLDRHPASPRAQLVPAHRPGRDVAAQHHPPRKGGEVAGHLVEHVQVVGLAEAGGQDQGRHPGLAEGIGQLGGPVGRVDVDQHGPDLGGGVLEDRPLGVVRRPDPDPLATLDPQRQQAPGHLLDGRMELGIGQAHALVHADQGVVVGDPGRRPVQVLPDGLTQQRHRARPMHVRGLAGHAPWPPPCLRACASRRPSATIHCMNPTWRAFRPLRPCGSSAPWLDAGAVHLRHSARGHLLALAVSNGIAS